MVLAARPRAAGLVPVAVVGFTRPNLSKSFVQRRVDTERTARLTRFILQRSVVPALSVVRAGLGSSRVVSNGCLCEFAVLSPSKSQGTDCRRERYTG